MTNKSIPSNNKLAQDTTIETIKTPQSLIHIKHNVSLLQYKYWILFIRELREQITNSIPSEEFGLRKISKKKIIDALGYEPYKQEIQDDLDFLRQQLILWNILEKDHKPAIHGTGFISEWRITSNFVFFKFPSLIEKAVYEMENAEAIFQNLNWTVFNQFTSKHTANLYKLAKDYIGVKKTPHMQISEFREYMGLKEGEHAEFKHLNARLIVTPCKDINNADFSDITVDAEYTTIGRKTTGVRFNVQHKNQQELPFIENDPSLAFAEAKTEISPVTQASYLKILTAEEIAICIAIVNSRYSNKTNVRYGALYRTAIKQGWHKEKQPNAKGGEDPKNNAYQKKLESERKEKQRREKSRFLAWLDKQENKDELIQNYRVTLGDSNKIRLDKEGVYHPSFLKLFAKFCDWNWE